MSKALIDPAALEEAAKWLEVHSSNSGSAEAFAADALREAIAQPAEAEGVAAGSKRLMETLAAMAMRKALRPLHDLCEQQKQVSTARLEQVIDSIGDNLAGDALNLRIEFDKLLAALSAVTAERDRLRDAAGKAIAWLDAEQNGSGVGINRRLKLCRDAENSLRAAMAAKEA